MYFFHKFILDDISFSTALQVIIPFAIFFLLSLFLVYLAKPVIKKVSRADLEKKKRGRGNLEDRRIPGGNPAQQTGQVFSDSEEYLPQMDYRTGPMPLTGGDEDMKIHAPTPRREPYVDELQSTSVIDRAVPSYDTARVRAPRQAEAAVPVGRPAPAVRRPMPPATSQERPARTRQAAPAVRRSPDVEYRQPTEEPQAQRVVSSVEIPSVSDDFFAKYDDPAYIERRLQELKGSGGEE